MRNLKRFIDTRVVIGSAASLLLLSSSSAAFASTTDDVLVGSAAGAACSKFWEVCVPAVIVYEGVTQGNAYLDRHAPRTYSQPYNNNWNYGNVSVPLNDPMRR